MVAGGLEVDTSDGMALYYAAGFRGSTFEDFGPVQPGDVAQVTVKEDGSTGGTPDWLVEIFDATTGQEFVGNKPYALVNTSAEAVESRFPNAGDSYDPLTQTSQVTFDVGRVFWADKAREQVKVTPLQGSVPADADLLLVYLNTPNGQRRPTVSQPGTDHDGVHRR
jgi:hypothetical protein